MTFKIGVVRFGGVGASLNACQNTLLTYYFACNGHPDLLGGVGVRYLAHTLRDSVGHFVPLCPTPALQHQNSPPKLHATTTSCALLEWSSKLTH